MPAALLLLAFVACAQPQEVTSVTGPGTLDRALARLRSLVEDTADAVLPGQPRTPRPGNEERVACMDELGAFTDERYASWGVAIDLDQEHDAAAIIDRTRTYWDAQGYEVDTSSAGADPPSLFLEFDGFNVEMLVNGEQGKAYLGGSTPCLPPT